MRLQPKPISRVKLGKANKQLFEAFDEYCRLHIRCLNSWGERNPNQAYKDVTVWEKATLTSLSGHEKTIPRIPFLSLEELDPELPNKFSSAAAALRACADFKKFDDCVVGLELLGGRRVNADVVAGQILRLLVARCGSYKYSRSALRALLEEAIAIFRASKFEVVTLHLLGPTFRSSIKHQLTLSPNFALCRMTTNERLALVNSEPDLMGDGRRIIPFGSFFIRQRRYARRAVGPPTPESPLPPPSAEGKLVRDRERQELRGFMEGVNALHPGGAEIVYTSIRCHDWLNPLSGNRHSNQRGGYSPLNLESRLARNTYAISQRVPFLERDRNTVEYLAFTRMARLGERTSDEDALLDLYICVELLFKSRKGKAIADLLPTEEMSEKKKHAAILARLGRKSGVSVERAEKIVMSVARYRNDIVHGNRRKSPDFAEKVKEIRNALEPLVYAALRSALS